VHPHEELRQTLTRRHFFGRATTGVGIGAAALASLLQERGAAGAAAIPGVIPRPHVPPRAQRVIYLFMHGGPSQMDLFDAKPQLHDRHGEDLPASIRMGQRLTTMSSNQKTLPVAPSPFRFSRCGQSGAAISELLPRLGMVADELCIIRSMHTEAINHDPAVTFLQTGHEQAGRPSFGSWVSYGLGSANADLPAFVVLTSRGSAVSPADPLYARLWGTGFLPSNHQGVCFRSSGDPVLFLSNPEGIAPDDRRRMLDTLAALNRKQQAATLDPEIATRIDQYEMAARMQTSVPDLTDFSREPAETFTLYGPEARTPGTFAANCLLARRLAERGVRFIQLYHRNWDQHYNLPTNLRLQCRDVDRPCAALVADLKRRGLLEDTLVIWGGEFGRTTYSQGPLTATNFGRDHHPRCFTMWLAGGGIPPGITHGETDDFCYNVVSGGVHVHDLNATLLHCLGVDHTRLTYRFQGRDYRLTDVHGRVIREILS
jgi:uncharacterized protein (DUF1501 family)